MREKLTPLEIKALRQALGYDYKGMAEALHTTPLTVRRWEQGIHRPSRLATSGLLQLKEKLADRWLRNHYSNVVNG